MGKRMEYIIDEKQDIEDKREKNRYLTQWEQEHLILKERRNFSHLEKEGKNK